MARTKAKGIYVTCKVLYAVTEGTLCVEYSNRFFKTTEMYIDCETMSESTKALICQCVKRAKHPEMSFLVNKINISYEYNVSVCKAALVKINDKWVG